jgi:membrane fusion protein (multidrug efflux system)
MFDETESDSSLEVTERTQAPAARRETPQARPEVPERPPVAPDEAQPKAPGRTPAASDKAQPKAPEGTPAAADNQTAPAGQTRRRWKRRAMFILLPLALIGGGYWYVVGGRIMSTDDAYVNADKVGISTDVSGTVAEVNVTDNQEVAAGQVLYRLDPLQFQIALANAQASRAQIALTLDAMKRDYRRMLTDVTAEQAQVTLDRTRYERATRLLTSGVESRAGYDQAQYTLQTDQSKLEALRQEARVQLARLSGNPDIPTSQFPPYLQAEAQVAEAQRELVHTVALAPFAGIVTNVPAIAPGKYLPASTTAFYLVDTRHVWIDATPKETELTYVRPGQPATLIVDTYPNLRWHGTVESLSPAAAQEFSLLPAQNTSGNWVKVVQRVQLRIRVDASSRRMPPLRAGMSVEVDIDTAHPRGLPHFLTSLF